MTASKFHLPAFKFDNGDVLDVTLAYKSINPSGAKKALITNCFTGLLGDTITYSGPSNALAGYHVVVVMQFANGESSSPSNTPNFPQAVSYQDQIRAQHALVTKELGFDHIDIVLGYSMGGQAVYHWAAMYPDFVKNGIAICATARTNGETFAAASSWITVCKLAEGYDEYLAKGTKHVKGVKAFYAAWIPWLYSPAFFKAETYKAFGAQSLDQFLGFAQDGGLDKDPKNLFTAIEQCINCDVGQVDGGLEKTLGSIKARMLLLPTKLDYQFPVEDVKEDAKHLKNVEVDIIPSIWGHVSGFGFNPEDIAWIDNRLKTFLSKV